MRLPHTGEVVDWPTYAAVVRQQDGSWRGPPVDYLKALQALHLIKPGPPSLFFPGPQRVAGYTDQDWVAKGTIKRGVAQRPAEHYLAVSKAVAARTGVNSPETDQARFKAVLAKLGRGGDMEALGALLASDPSLSTSATMAAARGRRSGGRGPGQPRDVRVLNIVLDQLPDVVLKILRDGALKSRPGLSKGEGYGAVDAVVRARLRGDSASSGRTRWRSSARRKSSRTPGRETITSATRSKVVELARVPGLDQVVKDALEQLVLLAHLRNSFESEYVVWVADESMRVGSVLLPPGYMMSDSERHLRMADFFDEIDRLSDEGWRERVEAVWGDALNALRVQGLSGLATAIQKFSTTPVLWEYLQTKMTEVP